MQLTRETCVRWWWHQMAVMMPWRRRTGTRGRRNRGRRSVVGRCWNWRRHSPRVATCPVSSGVVWRPGCNSARRRSKSGFRTDATNGSASPTWRRRRPHRLHTVSRLPGQTTSRPVPHTASRGQNTQRRGTTDRRRCRGKLALRLLWFQHSPTMRTTPTSRQMTLLSITVTICRHQSHLCFPSSVLLCHYIAMATDLGQQCAMS